MIRTATVNDIPALVDMGRRFLQESSYGAIMPFEPDSLASTFKNLILHDDGLLLVSGDENVTGMIGMHVFKHPLSGKKMAAENFWWMNPESRGGRDALRLLRDAESWVMSQGVEWMHMIAPSAKVAEFYERLGYSPLEIHFFKQAEAHHG